MEDDALCPLFKEICKKKQCAWYIEKYKDPNSDTEELIGQCAVYWTSQWIEDVAVSTSEMEK